MVKQRKRGIKGAGSVYQRKGDGRWVGSFKVEETGKRKYIYADTEKEAYQKLQQALQEQKQDKLATGPNQKLKDYLVNWLETVHRPEVYITTYAAHRIVINKHIIPALGEIQLRKLTTQQIQQFYTDKGNAGLAPGSIKCIHNVLHNALKNAVQWKLVSQNVSDPVILPPIKKYKKQILSKEQIVKLVEVANTHEMGPFIKLGLMSGLRHGEMLALKWQALNFETGVLLVEYNVTRPGLAGYGFVVGDPKTDEGTRTIILPQFVVDALKTHKERQQARRVKAGDKWRDNNLIFCNLTGGYVREDMNLARFRMVLKEAGLPETMRIHDLRHNVATFLINVLKYPPSLVQALLGHSNISITLGMYVRTDPEMLRPMMDDLNNLFGGS